MSRMDYAVQSVNDCPVCGKKTKRTHTFKYTLADDETFAHAMAKLAVMSADWKPDHTHRRCEANR